MCVYVSSGQILNSTSKTFRGSKRIWCKYAFIRGNQNEAYIESRATVRIHDELSVRQGCCYFHKKI